MRRKTGRITGWSVLGAALLLLVYGLTGVTPFRSGASPSRSGTSGPQSVDTSSVDGPSVVPELGESVVGFGSPLEVQVAEAPPFVDALELTAAAGPIGRLVWAGPGEIVPAAQFPNMALPGGIEPDFGAVGGPPATDAPFAAFGENADGVAGLSSGTLGSFLGAGGGAGSGTGSAADNGTGNRNGPPPPPGTGGDPQQVPEPSPVDLLQIALALFAGLVYRRFRA